MLPFTSLNAVTSDQSGTSKDLEGVFGLHTVLATATGSPTSGSIILQGSHDGTSWFNFGQSDFAGGQVALTATAALRYVRARLFGLGGGSSPTVTATVASVR